MDLELIKVIGVMAGLLFVIVALLRDMRQVRKEFTEAMALERHRHMNAEQRMLGVLESLKDSIDEAMRRRH